MSDTLSDPDTFARSIVQQYLFEHGMQTGNRVNAQVNRNLEVSCIPVL